jgi:2-polyprenyl-3-methyl-5-hydroxy-6-metoxy-1,4-benzoquinol methylase
MNRAEHWETVYKTKSLSSVSWYEVEPTTSLEMMDYCDVDPSEGIIDVGGGTSALVDGLLRRGCTDVTVMDISSEALRLSAERLGPEGVGVTWIPADVTEWTPPRQWRVWHDRAVFHFLAGPEQVAAYRSLVEAAVVKGGWVILATFGTDGPLRCSGLDVTRYSEETLAAALGDGFKLVLSFVKEHTTPGNADQQFQWTVFRRQ